MVEQMRILGLVNALRGKEIEACMKIPYKGHEISFSTRDGKPELRVFDTKDRLMSFEAYPGDAEDLKAAFKYVDQVVQNESNDDLSMEDRTLITIFATIQGTDAPRDHEVYQASKKAATEAYHRNLLTMDERKRVSNLYMNFMRECDSEVPDLVLRSQYRRAIYKEMLEEQAHG